MGRHERTAAESGSDRHASVGDALDPVGDGVAIPTVTMSAAPQRWITLSPRAAGPNPPWVLSATVTGPRPQPLPTHAAGADGAAREHEVPDASGRGPAAGERSAPSSGAVSTTTASAALVSASAAGPAPGLAAAAAVAHMDRAGAAARLSWRARRAVRHQQAEQAALAERIARARRRTQQVSALSAAHGPRAGNASSSGPPAGPAAARGVPALDSARPPWSSTAPPAVGPRP